MAAAEAPGIRVEKASKGFGTGVGGFWAGIAISSIWRGIPADDSYPARRIGALTCDKPAAAGCQNLSPDGSLPRGPGAGRTEIRESRADLPEFRRNRPFCRSI
ncbi:MAG: hypothetical protein A2092_06955 [Rhodobacteraceae bacterium GWE1_64_9]|nr:MAG: hypothetical protein A2092_06955 [Rhodobacteraceae bacterium GWE1_64_9]